ncbi:type II toxin-antitoxin system PemK/MazF family toxin [Magnetospirillum sp. 15-1]|uniref:type II toxin-antitoxin system PemK/MazF family toxin n=1 Tax=Magnetospirillum sp. 15-1 TaxID=1979370 RepID=UPI000BBC93BC|nr:type II toxin-antitoxin system PemK/MazF family toxin [Magnetospirillum sp. 15-1]
MGFEPFDVVVVPFPFTDKVGAKRRPALVVSTSAFNDRHDQVVLAMITTARQRDWPSDVHIDDWDKAGLTAPCRVRFKLFTLEQSLILRRTGSLAKKDKAAIQAALSNCLATG